MPRMPMPRPPNYTTPFAESPLTSTAGKPPVGASGSIGITAGVNSTAYNPNPGDTYGRNSISEDQLLQSVRSAVLDKLRRTQRELLMQHRDEIQSLQETHADLVRGGASLEEMLSRMDREKLYTLESVL
ncbi:unnamed protein product [Echinostoma caproni]|uniref:TMF_TATA_bd domain-containing protein n=1 Tax=Echinostoma caproni TaxID=27848 RepID=A0A183AXR0_9TREM|nr:unnamed protein product [Echinostoma caproni]